MIYAAAYPEKFEGEKGSKLMQVTVFLNQLVFPTVSEVFPIYCIKIFGPLLNEKKKKIFSVCMYVVHILRSEERRVGKECRL